MVSAKFTQDMKDSRQECHLVEQKYKPSSEGKMRTNRKKENELTVTQASTDRTCGSLTTGRMFLEGRC